MSDALRDAKPGFYWARLPWHDQVWGEYWSGWVVVERDCDGGWWMFGHDTELSKGDLHLIAELGPMLVCPDGPEPADFRSPPAKAPAHD